MLKRFLAALVISLLVAAFAAAQTQQQTPPKPSPEVKKLDYFIGNWKSEGEIKPGQFGPGGKFSATEQNEWMPGGFFLLSHADKNPPMGSGKGLAVLGYNTNERVYP